MNPFFISETYAGKIGKEATEELIQARASRVADQMKWLDYEVQFSNGLPGSILVDWWDAFPLPCMVLVRERP